MRVRYTRRAKDDLVEIYTYIAEENPPAARQVIAKIREGVKHLAHHPHVGRIGRVADTRELVIPRFPYIVVYRVRDDGVQILSIFHSSREWPDEF
jgi:addiction module RelE/StbE family toxin